MYHSESSPNPYGGLPVRSEELISMFKVRRRLDHWTPTMRRTSVCSVRRQAIALPLLYCCFLRVFFLDFSCLLVRTRTSLLPIFFFPLAVRLAGSEITRTVRRPPTRDNDALKRCDGCPLRRDDNHFEKPKTQTSDKTYTHTMNRTGRSRPAEEGADRHPGLGDVLGPRGRRVGPFFRPQGGPRGERGGVRGGSVHGGGVRLTAQARMSREGAG